MINKNEVDLNDPNIFKKVKCGVCKKKVSTRLCDFVVAYRQPTFFRNYEDFSEQELHETCDFPMCESCATSYNGIYDFCPHHKEMIEKVKPTKEMQKEISRYHTQQMFEHWT